MYSKYYAAVQNSKKKKAVTIYSREASRSSMGKGKIDKADRSYIGMRKPCY